MKGLTQSDGQDFSKHDTLRFWLYGDKSNTTFVLQLAPTVRTSYRSSFYSSDPFVSQTQEEDINVFENLTDYYEYTVPIDFEGWKLIEIDLRDLRRNTYPDIATNNQTSAISQEQFVETESGTQPPDVDSDSPDGHPDGFTVRGRNNTRLSIKNIGGILLGIRNDTGQEISGDIWVNEIHLGGSHSSARVGRAAVTCQYPSGTFLKSVVVTRVKIKTLKVVPVRLADNVSLHADIAPQNNDFNIDADVTIFPWLPIRYGIRQQDTETESLRGSYSSFRSGKSEILTRDFSLQFNRNPYPNLGFAYNYQDFWNERQGTQISHLYTGSFRYELGSKLGVNAQYRHEDVLAKPETATDTTTTSTSYYSYGYGRNQDEKTDSGTITLNINPTNIFSLNPSYDVRRTLERREDRSYSSRTLASDAETASETQAETKPDFSNCRTRTSTFVYTTPESRFDWFASHRDKSYEFPRKLVQRTKERFT